MLLTTSVVKSAKIPDTRKDCPCVLITFSTTTFVFLGEKPDMNYEATSDIIGAGYGTSILINKKLAVNGEIHYYQTSGSDSYVGIVEVC